MQLASKHRISSGDNILIVGLGLAGSLLAWRLIAQGFPVKVCHQALPGQASRVAPGLINPLASRKLQMDDRFPEMLASASQLFDQMEEDLGTRFFQRMPILRILRNEVQAKSVSEMLAASTNDARHAYCGTFHPPGSFEFITRDHWGVLETIGGGWVDLPLLCKTMENELRGKGLLIEETYNESMASDADWVIDCRGWQAINDPRWSYLPHNPAKGELLLIEAQSALPRDRILHAGTWLQPLGDHIWRAGSRYSWDDFNSEPSEAGCRALARQLREWLACDWKEVGRQAGVRPIMDDYKPVIGSHPENPSHVIVNGLGSKGAIQAPWLVDNLLAHLLEGKTIPPLVDVARFASLKKG
jgi:glycine/D-amino acid oxidase-like deaminating enzyme